MMIHLYLYDLRVYIFFLGGGVQGRNPYSQTYPSKNPGKFTFWTQKLEVWKMIFQGNFWVAADNFQGCTLRSTNMAMENPHFM